MSLLIMTLLVLGAIGLGWGLYLERRIEQNEGVWRGKYMADAEFDQMVGGLMIVVGVLVALLTVIGHVLYAMWLGVI